MQQLEWVLNFWTAKFTQSGGDGEGARLAVDIHKLP